MRKLLYFTLALMVTLTAVGCAKKSASEQLREDMNKAAKQIDKDVKNLIN